MPSVSEATNSSKPPLGNVLAAGVNYLSANQKITFTLYHRYIFPLDGMNYWIKVTDAPVANKQSIPEDALTTYVPVGKEAVQVCPGLIGATNIVGGIIMNPADATELLFVDFAGPAYSYANETTFALAPGESIDTPSNLQNGIWVNALTSGHQFSINIWENIESVNLPAQMIVQGSLHRDSIIEQREDATVDISTIIFTSLSEVQAFDRIGPDYLYIAHYAGLAFAFSSRGQLYEQADLYHYMGKALFSTNSTQIVDDFADFNPTLIVSNSLPIWLNMPNYVPFYPTFTCPITLYPSYLVNDDLPPPFGSVHIENTTSLAATPMFGRRMSSDQFCRDEVIVHLYGCDNLIAQDFMAFVEQYSCDWSFIGIANMPVIKDEKHIQAEFKILAQRKSIKFDVNYFQSASRDIARQFIEHVKVQFTDPLELGEQQCQ